MPPEVRELASGESAHAWAAMRELRPHVGAAGDFAERVDAVQRPQGYRLVASFKAGETEASAVAGFRCGDNLAWGHFLYVDDLTTRADRRRQGHAAALISWLRGEARRLGCQEIHLDSGTVPDRWDAHAFYFAEGLRISSHHFAAAVGRE